MKKNQKLSAYATVNADEGINYREIADMMSEIGFKMNHSSARNYVLRVMRKFAEAIVDNWGIEIDENSLDSIIKSPLFQRAICDMLQDLQS